MRVLWFIVVKPDKKFRIVIPEKVRQQLNLRSKDAVELSVLRSFGDAVVLKLAKTPEVRGVRISRNMWEVKS